MLRAGVGKCNLCFFREKIRIHSSWYSFYGNVCESEAVPEESLKINYMFYLEGTPHFSVVQNLPEVKN